MRARVRACLSVLAAALALGGVGVSSALGADPVDFARELKSRDVKRRLAAVDTLAKDGGENAAGLLEDALRDDDWEVAERAAVALADRGRPESVRHLAAAAAEGRVWRLRRAAARTLARLDPEAAAKELAKDLRGDAGVQAAEAMALIAQGAGARAGDQLRKGLERALKAKDAPLRAAAASALAGFPAEARSEHFVRLLSDPDVTVVAAALDEAARAPEPAYFTPIVTRFEEPTLNDVLERRAAAAIRASLVAIPVAAEKASRISEMSAAFARAKEPAVAGRFARLFGLLAAAPPPAAPEEPKVEGKDGKPSPPAGDPPPPAKPAAPPPEPVVAADLALKALAPALEHRGEAARASAAFALGKIRTPEALARAAQMVHADAHPRVRLQALRVVATGRGIADPETLALVIDRLAKDPATSVREEAAVLLGEPGPDGKPLDAAVKALEAALADPEWSVVVVAAVSLGKTQSPAAVEPLRRLTAPKEVKDWRRRGAAIVGLGTLRQRGAVPPLIEALADKDPSVRRTAYEYLRRLTSLSMVAEPEPWRRWWDRAGPNYEFIDRQKAEREAKKGGYAPTPIEVYEHLDITVLESRGDHIQKLLTELKINHRLTRAGALPVAELNPFCIFVSNCTGEILPEDVERLQWFVRVGGYLFCSCWALHYTVELVYPGLVQKLPTKAEVLDNVVAEACPGNSPFLDGVFRDFTRPVYVLYGAHIIEVLQPERVEVLIDSPVSAQHWGGGDLACWFSAGHGVILDSVNHFELQGLQRVNGLKTGPDRMAYAMDHLGVDYEEARALADAHVWEKQAEAVDRVHDLSTFRFITNFVRQKRKADL